MRRPYALLMAMGLMAVVTAGWLRAQDAGDAAAEEEAAEEPVVAAPKGKKPKTMGKDKAGIEAYLKHRLAAIKSQHKARMDFMAKDAKEWTDYWNKVKDERNLFEVRIARQRLDLFESLGSLEQKEHGTAIGDFERLQTNVIKAFENQQRGKMMEFFSMREKRWKEFYGSQEKDRLAFAAEVDTSWEQLKSNLKIKGGKSSSSSSGPPPNRF